jgi:hypothetical protein
MSAAIIKILKLSKIFETASTRILAAKETTYVQLERDKYIANAKDLISHFKKIKEWLDQYKAALLEYKLKNKNAKINTTISKHFDDVTFKKMQNSLTVKIAVLGTISTSLLTSDAADTTKMSDYHERIIAIHSDAEEWMDGWWMFYFQNKPSDMNIDNLPKVPEL